MEKLDAKLKNASKEVAQNFVFALLATEGVDSQSMVLFELSERAAKQRCYFYDMEYGRIQQLHESYKKKDVASSGNESFFRTPEYVPQDNDTDEKFINTLFERIKLKLKKNENRSNIKFFAPSVKPLFRGDLSPVTVRGHNEASSNQNAATYAANSITILPHIFKAIAVALQKSNCDYDISNNAGQEIKQVGVSIIEDDTIIFKNEDDNNVLLSFKRIKPQCACNLPETLTTTNTNTNQ